MKFLRDEDWTWSLNPFVGSREKWDSEGYASQTPEFIQKADDGKVRWGYHGQRTSGVVQDIRVSDLRWILKFVGRITDAQIRAGLQASGAAPAEVKTFTTAIRARIDQMRAAARQQTQLKAALQDRD